MISEALGSETEYTRAFFAIASAIGAFITEGVLELSLFMGLLAGIISLFFKTKTKVPEKKAVMEIPEKQESIKGMTRFERYLLFSGIVSVITAYFALKGDSSVSDGIVISLIVGFMVGLLSLPFNTQAESRANEIRKREAEERERARKAPGCHSMDNVDILTFSSSNNILTDGNNAIKLRIRNRNPYAVIVSICFRYSELEIGILHLSLLKWEEMN